MIPKTAPSPLVLPDPAVDDVPSSERDAFPFLVEEVRVDLGRALHCFPGSLQSHVAELQVLGVRGADPVVNQTYGGF